MDNRSAQDQFTNINPDIFDDDLTVPEVGLKFSSREDAYAFYRSYSCRVGFGIVRRSNHNFYGQQSDATFACSKEKKPLLRAKSEGFKKRRHSYQGTCCPAKIVVKDYLLDGNWTISFAENNHNHPCRPDAVRYMRCHRTIPDFVKKQIEINDDSGIPQNRSFHSMFNQAGGHDNCSFTERDMRNHIHVRRALKLAEGDANALVKYFKERQKKCSNFFYLCEIDNVGRLRNVFWADGRSRAAYKYFGDVITFDTTYLTNKYDMPFAPFVGVNHHGQSILLACALLADECIPTYEWLFHTFLDCMDSVPPLAIITDQCAAMCSAVSTVFPLARHRLCLWHIMKKLPTKAGSGDTRDAFMSTVCDLVYDSEEPFIFEEGWQRLISDEVLPSRLKWLERMYDIRSKWVPLYVRKHFWAGMSTTQRSESMNSFFDGYVNSSTSLRDFADKYELALQAKWEKERLEDFRCSDRSAALVSMLPFETQFAQSYTHRMFYQFQDEVKALISCHSQLTSTQHDVNLYEVVDAADNKPYRVQFCTTTDMYYCQCLLFQFKGIICRHGLTIYRQLRVNAIPASYFLPRWQKDFIRTHTRLTMKTQFIHRDLSSYDYVYTRVHSYLLNLVECTYRDEKAVSQLMERLDYLAIDLTAASDISDDTNGDELTNDEHNENVSDPKRVKRLGRPRSTRFKSRIEIARLKKFKKPPTGRRPTEVSTSKARAKDKHEQTTYTNEDMDGVSNIDLLMHFSQYSSNNVDH